ncbi:unnamed protein product [Pieris brassicae]|uniref:Uncharacterized protein n=1 Tax=Pieris brassicae TaxID=7116 RepID=A0A9P0TDK3_PIEBR|nr:unnamed protein product [Pieris brassicae]
MEVSLSQICELLGERIEKYNSIPKKRKLSKVKRLMTSTPILEAFPAKMFSPNLVLSPAPTVNSEKRSTPRKRATRDGLRGKKLVFHDEDDNVN